MAGENLGSKKEEAQPNLEQVFTPNEGRFLESKLFCGVDALETRWLLSNLSTDSIIFRNGLSDMISLER
jgi:hypothetical protein